MQTQTNPNQAIKQQQHPHSNDVSTELQNVSRALTTVFSRTSQPPPQTNGHPLDQHTHANEYLTSFQHLPIAWMVCDRMLSSTAVGTSSPEMLFFAAQTLHTKCREEVHQLPNDALTSLRDSLVVQILQYSSCSAATMNKALVTRLGLAIAALAVQMNWNTVVTDLLHKRSQIGPHEQEELERMDRMVLELFQLLPEECCSDRLWVLDDRARWDYQESLRESAPLVFRFLMEMLSSEKENTNKRSMVVFATFQTWLRYIPIDPNVILDGDGGGSHLVMASFAALNNPNVEIFEMGVDVIIELIRVYPSDNRHNKKLVESLIPLVMNLKGDANSGGGFHMALNNEDEDRLRGYCRIFTEMGESYMSLIMAPEEMQQEQLVELVLVCSAIPDNEIAGITLNFWYRFVHSLEQLLPQQFRQLRIDNYQPLLLRLIQICVTLLKYPEHVEELQEDQLDDVHRDRRYVSDTIEDCCRLIGGNEVLTNLGERLQQECQTFSATSKNYQGVEACIMAILSISRFVPNDEPNVLPFLFSQVFTNLPSDITKLRYTNNLCIGKYASWLSQHVEYLQPLLPYLAQGLYIPHTASASAVAVKQLCEKCKEQALGESVLQLYEGLFAQQPTPPTTHNRICCLELKDEIELLEGVCKAISSQPPSSPATSNMVARIVQPIGARLAMLMAQPPENMTTSKRVMEDLERLTVIVRFLHPSEKGTVNNNLVVELMKESWELLNTLTAKYPNDVNLAEKVCRLHKHAMRSCGRISYAPLLEPLMAQLIQNFQSSYLSPWLYAASICITEFGTDPNYVPRLFHLISEMSNTVFLKLKGLDDFVCNPDIVEEYFYLTARFMSYCPEPLVLNTDLLQSVIQCAVVGMHVQHREANKGTLVFLENTIGVGLTVTDTKLAIPPTAPVLRASLEKVILNCGQAVVNNLAGALLGELPAYSLDRGSGSVAGVLWKLNELCPELVLQWIGGVLVQAPELSGREFMGALKDMVNRDEFNATLRKFKYDCERARKLRNANAGVEGERQSR